jgi:hypothetical protein
MYVFAPVEDKEGSVYMEVDHIFDPSIKYQTKIFRKFKGYFLSNISEELTVVPITV